jgi:4-hydroxybenzoate polyprenyltransferase
METPAVFSWPELVVAYVRERYRARLFLPLAALLATAGMLAAGARFDAPLSVVRAVITCYALVLAFRVWDDLEDRERDRREHPDRVLVRTGLTTPWVLLIGIALLTGGVLVSLGAGALQRLAVLTAGAAMLLAWYRTRRAIAAHPLVDTSVIFAKYPLIAFVSASPAQPTPPLLSATVLVALYLVLCIYELADDTTLRGSIP